MIAPYTNIKGKTHESLLRFASDSELFSESKSTEIFEKSRDPLNFRFCGYSIWLDICGSEEGGDYYSCIDACAEKFGLEPIQGHVTVIYGMTHLTDEEVRRTFRDELMPRFMKERRKWPSLKPIGVLSDVELDGVRGGMMDMAWSEISFSNSDEHESCVDLVHQIFYGSAKDREGIWRPHASLVYDNPHSSPLNLFETMKVVAKYPSLLSSAVHVRGISLVKTEGYITEWKVIDHFSF